MARATAKQRLIADWLTPFVKAHDFSGVVAVQRGAAKPILWSAGRPEMGSGRRLSPRTHFGVESVSKLFTVDALKALRDAGKLSVDDRLAKWLPDFPDAEAITLRMLVNHQAGLGRDLVGFESEWSKPHTLAELIEVCKMTPAAGKTGAGFVYSNNGYRVLARVLELADGADYGEIVRKRVLVPQGMYDTREWSLGDSVDEPAKGYIPGAAWGSLQPAQITEMTNLRGAASYCSTAADLLRFAASRPGPASGMKPFTSDGHDGRGHGFIATCYRYPVEQTSIVVLGNVESGVFDSLKNGLEQIVFKGEAPTLRPPVQTPLVAFVSPDMLGTYDLFGGKLVLGRTASGDYFADSGDGPIPLAAISETRMFSRTRYATLSFVRGVDGVKISWSEPSGTFDLKKIT